MHCHASRLKPEDCFSDHSREVASFHTGRHISTSHCDKHLRAGLDLQQGSGLAQRLIRLQVLSHAGCHDAD